MTEQEQRLAIAESCGWKYSSTPADGGYFGWASPDGGCLQDAPDCFPDYLHDLNAMNEAVKSLRPEIANEWAGELTRITSFGANPHWTHWYHLANATAAQRAEAFLRCIGRWIDE